MFRKRGLDDGASAVEFALVLPVFAMLVYGMIGGGFLLAQKLSISHATREASRYAATLPTTQPGPDLNAWLAQVAGVVRSSAGSDLTSGSPQVCVAYIDGTGTSTRYQGDGTTSGATYGAGTCFTDNEPPAEARVQVSALRSSTWSLLVTPTWHLSIGANAVTRYEVPTISPSPTASP